MKYAIVIEKGKRNYSAYVPDLPGCIATGRTLAGVKRNITEAIDFHLQGLAADGETIPAPRALVDFVPAKIH
jgi:predicted RNase H-like HicB family nuclease